MKQPILEAALKQLKKLSKNHTVFAGDVFEQNHLLFLVKNQYVEKIFKGWYRLKSQTDSPLDNNASLLEFLQEYLTNSAGAKNYCMRPDISLLFHAGIDALPKRIDVTVKSGANTTVPLPTLSSLLYFGGDAAGFPIVMDKKHGLNIYTIEESLCKVGDDFIDANPLVIETAVNMITDISVVVNVLLINKRMRKAAARMVELLNRFKRPRDAEKLSRECETLLGIKVSPAHGKPRKTMEELNADFLKAREYVHSLNLDRNSWRLWAKGELQEKGLRPSWVSSCPDVTYKDAGWISWSDWWHGDKPARWMSFYEAREYVHGLGLKSRLEWVAYCSGKLNGFAAKPANIPVVAEKVYAEEWINYDDFLGCGYLPFEEAREFARSLNLKGQKEWLSYAYGKMPSFVRPLNIPANPYAAYADQWTGYGDWLGTSRKRAFNGKFPWRDFESAREYARSLKLSRSIEWYPFVALGNAPADIPHAPDFVYRDLGWDGWADWFGVARYAGGRRDGRLFDFNKAWDYAKSLKLKNSKEWKLYVHALDRELPSYVPKVPNLAFGDAFPGWSVWLGEKNAERQ